jgi:predicted RNase H-like HicB family nuclease
MKREFTVVVERDAEGYFVATVPAIRGCHTQARTRDELDLRIREAIELCLETDQTEVPDLELVSIERISISA